MGSQLPQALSLTPAAIHYPIVRGENFLREDKEVEEGLNKFLKNLTPMRSSFLGDLSKSPEISDYTPACRRAGIRSRLHRHKKRSDYVELH